MLYETGNLAQNNAESKAGGMIKYIGADMLGSDTALVADDVIVLGALPIDSFTLDMRIPVNEAFDAGGFELGYYEYPTGLFVPFAVVVAGAIDEAGKCIVLDMPTTGQIDDSDTTYVGNRGAIWNGDSETVIALKWVGATPTTGKAQLVTSHTYFGTRDGAYGGSYVPLTPYRQ